MRANLPTHVESPVQRGSRDRVAGQIARVAQRRSVFVLDRVLTCVSTRDGVGSPDVQENLGRYPDGIPAE